MHIEITYLTGNTYIYIYIKLNKNVSQKPDEYLYNPDKNMLQNGYHGVFSGWQIACNLMKVLMSLKIPKYVNQIDYLHFLLRNNLTFVKDDS